MQHFETITFGSSGLDRAANLRKDADFLANAHKDPRNQAILFWQGKPLVSGESDLSLVRLSLTHPVLKIAKEAPIFMGIDREGGCFAYDISAWDPQDQELHDGSFLDNTEQQHPDFPEAYFRDLRNIMTQLDRRDAELASTARSLLSWHETHQFCSRCGAKSDLSMAGWERTCPSCDAKHFPRVDPVAIMLITHGNKLLLGRGNGWPDRMYSTLAGFVEPGETPEAAVRREVFEEAGVRVGKVNYIASQPWAFPSNLMIGCHGEAETTAITIDPEEIEDARWVTREDVMLAFSGDHPDIKPARKGSIAHFMMRKWLANDLD